MSRLCFAAFCSAVVFAGLAAAQTPAVVAIRNARIVPVSGPVIEKGTVVVRNGLIAEVGASAAVPADAWVMEADGLTVYPGLIDALGSIGIPEVARALPGAAPGPGGPPPQSRGPEDRPLTNSWVRAADLIRPNERRIETARAAGYTTSVTFPSSGIFAGQGAVVDLGGDNAGRMVIDARAGQLLTLARGGFAFFPGSLMGTIAYIRQVFLDADHYRQAKELYEAKPQGLTRPAYDRALEGVLDSPRVLLPAVSVVEIDRMVKFAAESKRPTILYGAHDGYRAAETIVKSGLPVLVSLKWPEAPRDADPDEQESMRLLELRENAPSTPAVLAKSGVKFAFYSDGAENVHRALRRAIDKGLTPEQALRAATLSAAEIFGVADRVGSIEPGKIANLIVVKGDLFADRPQIQHVFVDGVRYEPPPPAPPAKPEATQ
jgi:imidazolonepropionase-like amidohydrolase